MLGASLFKKNLGEKFPKSQHPFFNFIKRIFYYKKNLKKFEFFFFHKSKFLESIATIIITTNYNFEETFEKYVPRTI